MSSTIKITVKTLTGKEVFINVDPLDPVERVKEYLEEKEGILPSQQRLIHDGKQLDDDVLLKDAGITEGSLLHLVLTLRGGF